MTCSTTTSTTTTTSTFLHSSSRSAITDRPNGTRTLGPAQVRFTGRNEGDLRAISTGAAGSDELRLRQHAIVDLPWVGVRQVHGAAVATVTASDAGSPPAIADGVVTRVRRLALAIKVADCAPVALASREGVIGAAHAGWRGLVEGVIENTVSAMRGIGATDIVAAVGPCIHVECYEFSTDDIETVASAFGEGVRGATRDGRPALDVPAAVDAALARAGVSVAWREDACTACDAQQWYSHRARQDPERQALAIWLP